MTDPIRLTQLAKRAGCAAKQPPGYLLSLLGSLPPITDPNVLVGSATADDAAVYKLSDDLALVFTTDFFTPIVDRPYDFGAVAAANALSDVYAMGGTPLTALSIVGFPDAAAAAGSAGRNSARGRRQSGRGRRGDRRRAHDQIGGADFRSRRDRQGCAGPRFVERQGSARRRADSHQAVGTWASSRRPPRTARTNSARSTMPFGS